MGDVDSTGATAPAYSPSSRVGGGGGLEGTGDATAAAGGAEAVVAAGTGAPPGTAGAAEVAPFGARGGGAGGSFIVTGFIASTRRSARMIIRGEVAPKKTPGVARRPLYSATRKPCMCKSFPTS